jgi:penicillin G amidase
MSRWLKIIIGLFVSFVIVFTVGGFVFYRLLTSSLPQYDGQIKVPGIFNDVTVYHDSMAVPYIIAHNDEDAVFALGYLHAQERMFQMDLIRRAGEGRLSEIFGPKTVEYDEMFRTVGIERTAEKILNNLSPISKRLLQAYAKGVNLYIRKAKGHYPIEFDVLHYDPEPWKPIHSIIVMRMMAWELNISWWVDIVYSELVQKFGEERASEIIPDFPSDAPTIIPYAFKKFSHLTSDLMETDKRFRDFMGWTGTHIGSNNWVVDGKKSATGKPIIANDPHLAYSAPGKWYAAVVKGGNLNVAGVTLPGLPGVVIGKNKDISWVLTNIMEDDADFYYEKFDSTGRNYLYDGKWIKPEIIKDTIKVKDSTDVPYEITITNHGPIISNIHPYSFVYGDRSLDTARISMQWLGNFVSDEVLAFYIINTAKNWRDFKVGVNLFSVPGQNFVYADKSGNIGYLFGARLPLREDNYGALVLDGTTGKYNWKGFVPENELPSLFNPPQNFIATANNKTEKDFKYYISNLWEPSSRIERITELLEYKSKHSVKDFENYQNDFVSPYARELTPYIIDAFKDVKITDNNLKRTMELLENWNFEMDQYSQTPAIYSVFFKYLMKNIFSNKMGDTLFNEYIFLQSIPLRTVKNLMKTPESFWFDDPRTPEIENRDEIIRKCMSEALTELENKFGKDIAKWQWGNLHYALFKHPFSGFSSLIDRYIDIGPFPIGGDGTTLNSTEYRFTKSIPDNPAFSHGEFENVLGPSMRFVFDFSTPDKFYLILTTGESGNVLSDHYRDMSQMWLHGKYIVIRTDAASIKNNKRILIMRPAN